MVNVVGTSACGDKEKSSVEPILYVNGKRYVLPDGIGEKTLIQFLRDAGLKGTKLGCGEGGCGACTVMVSHYDCSKGSVIHRAVNACLAPIYSVEGMHVVTVEGIGNRRMGLHPVQERLANLHGSQCGFCTPGFVMSMYTLLRNCGGHPPSQEQVAESLAGNLCRCTGYRPILDAFRTLAKTDDGAYASEGVKGSAGGGGGADGVKICPGSGLPCDCGSGGVGGASKADSSSQMEPFNSAVWEAASHAKAVHTPESTTTTSSLPTSSSSSPSGGGCKGGGGCCGGRGCGSAGAGKPDGDLYASTYPPCASAAEPIFPPELKARVPPSLQLQGGPGGHVGEWHRPTTLEQLLGVLARCRREGVSVQLIGGNTEIGIEAKFKGKHFPCLVATSLVAPLHTTSVTEGGITFGAGLTLTGLETFLHAVVKDKPPAQTPPCVAMLQQLRWFAGTQIRNVATVGGNIVTGSPISDLNPIYMAAGALFTLASATEDGMGGPVERQVAAREFFLGYRKVDLRPGEVLVSVTLPFTRDYEYVKEFKQARRREDDIAIVNAGMRVAFVPGPSGTGGAPTWIVASASLAFGGVAPVTLCAPKTEAWLVGKEWSEGVAFEAVAQLAREIVIADNAPGGMVEFRRSLVGSFFFKFFVFAARKLHGDLSSLLSPPPAPAPLLPASYLSACDPCTEGIPKGCVSFGGDPLAPGDITLSADGATDGSQGGKVNGDKDGADGRNSDRYPVGAPFPHASAALQVTGDAEYTDDAPAPAGMLHAALVMSSRPHAEIVSIDVSAATALPGVTAVLTARDVPGTNLIGPVFADEQLLADRTAVHVGQPVALVVAESELLAKRGAAAVVISYNDLTPILTIEDAIAKGSFFPNPGEGHGLTAGDVDTVFAAAGSVAPGAATHVVEGVARMGAQEHFYLEPNVAVAVPRDGGREMFVLSSTQAVNKTQAYVSKVLGLPMHKVVAVTKRIGGGFGGKETRTMWVASLAALGAHATNQPVRLCLDRDADMSTTGQRHPFLAKYKVAADPTGLILAADVSLFSNGGCSMDLSWPVLDRAIFHSDNAYRLPNLRVRGRICKTNLPTNTAFRGFGAPQGMFVVESWMDHVAATLGMPAEAVKARNLYRENGDVTHFGQQLTQCTLGRIWRQLHEEGEVERLRQEAAAFNAAHRWKKRGVAVVPTKFGISFTAKFMNQAGALVHVYTDGTALVTHGGVEMGQGLHTKMAQVAAQALGIPLRSVYIQETASDKVPNASPTAASASSDLYGMAVLDACHQIRDRLKPFLAAMPGAPFKEVVNAAYMERVDLSAHGFYKTPDIHFDFKVGKGMPFNYFAYGGAAALVEVDVLTGDSRALRADIVHDVGRSLNAAIDIGQVEGAFVQGMGWSTMEEVVYGDPEHPWVPPGRLFTQGPGTYKIPTLNDIPLDFRCSLLKGSTNVRAIHSSKAVGEPPFFLGSVVFFAIKEAIRAARVEAGLPAHFTLDLPATPERIRMACGGPLSAAVGDGYRPKLSV
eukprot:jgi/Mesvir1/27688/Mv07407-RA.1